MEGIYWTKTHITYKKAQIRMAEFVIKVVQARKEQNFIKKLGEV